MKTFVRISLVAVCGLLAAACSESPQFRNREAGAVTGAAVGAGLGAIVGNQTGSTGAGVAIGSAAGALVGGIVGNSLDGTEDRQQEQAEILKRQEAEIARQRREIEDLKRQEYHNDSFRRYDRSAEPPAGDGSVVDRGAPSAPAPGEGPAYNSDVAPAPGDDFRY